MSIYSMEISIKDLMLFYEVSEKTARNRFNEISSYFGLRSKRLTYWHLSQYEGVPVSVIKSVIRCC